MLEPSATTSLIVLQPTAFCNIGCTYCYLPDTRNRSMLSLGKLEELLRRVFVFPTLREHVTICWHAGEPLVLGPNYYEQAFNIVERTRPPHLAVSFAFQTNGMLITNAWCDLFRRWRVGVGVSIDGPRHLHDANRKTRSGAGTFDKTLAGIQCLRENDIAFNIITVLTQDSLRDPQAMFQFYKENGLHNICFNVEEKEGRHETSSLHEDADIHAFYGFLEAFAQLMVEHDFPIEVREYERTAQMLQHAGQIDGCNEEVLPFGIISIDVKGDVYTFSPELVGTAGGTFETFSIGNIFQDTFEQLVQSPNLLRMSKDIAGGVSLCRDRCAYFGICGGGSPANKIFENGTFASDETMHCRLAKKVTVDFVLQSILTTAARATNESPDPQKIAPERRKDNSMRSSDIQFRYDPPYQYAVQYK